MSGELSKAVSRPDSDTDTDANSPWGSPAPAGSRTPSSAANLATLPALHPTLSTVCKFCRRGAWTMNDGPAPDYEPLPPGPFSVAGAPTAPPLPLDGYTEQGASLVFVGLLLLLLAVLLVRCFRVLLDPFSRMPSSSWTDHKEGLERGQFEYALV
ncbi:cortexin-1-like isoform X3 [Anguilla anguilla]|uniref:cortexin-1-like isoform X1 n=1 Tax=Anguilla anguilla TaxID=7936 RepID=UPI0015B00694|nr:cortexin-1-like isoform X1 [Anguilla anguilla]XP_035278156.1 cortexin-1-like isoform X1 [Anguilla anguilla]XP_035278157.1 cortexin-1-like isoform X2 [Anguilla anguilla]XP_035278158.1 cortexin-1-like isoform X3 [Anguilla anguilla]